MANNDWTEQSQALMQSWVDAQKMLWQSWTNMFAPTQTNPTNIMEQWQKAVQQNLETMMSGSAPIAQTTAEQFVAAQGIVLRFLEFSMRAWQATAPKFESGGDWQSAMKQSVDQFRQEWLRLPTDAAAAAQDTDKLWHLYMEQWKNFGQPWEAFYKQMPSFLSQAAMGKGSALVELSNQYHEAYNQTIGRLASSPNLGLTRELNQKMSKGFDAFVAQQLANLEYQGVLAEIWEQAFAQFSKDLIALAEEGAKIENVRDLILLWTRGAEKVFTDAFRSEKYVLAQGKLLNGSMSYRMSQREVIEVFLKMYDLPTRSELDETHRRIYELRKEVKQLKKQLAAKG